MLRQRQRHRVKSQVRTTWRARIAGLADQRVADVGEVQAHLVFAAGLQSDVQQRRVVVAVEWLDGCRTGQGTWLVVAPANTSPRRPNQMVSQLPCRFGTSAFVQWQQITLM